MQSIAHALIVLWGWRRLAVACIAGAVSALAMPPWSAFPLLWLSVPVFVWLIDGAVAPEGSGFIRRLLPAAAVGWAYGFGYFLCGLWWIGAAFLVDADKFAWLMPVAVLLLPAGLALFWGFGAALARLFWPEGWPRILVFAAAMTAAEWLRCQLLTGFPWNAFGYALTPAPLMMQSAALIGLWGLTLASFIVFAAPAVLDAAPGRLRRGPVLFLAFAIGVFLFHLGFGALRLAGADDRTEPGMRLRIVQPAIDQSEKWQAGNEAAIFRRFVELTSAPDPGSGAGLESITHVIWPESAFPFYLTDRSDALATLAAMLPDGVTLIAGAARAEPGSGSGGAHIFNSIYVIGDDGGILDAYDKVHLVPFGEFLPFQPFLESLGLRQLTSLPGGFSAGPRLRTLRVPGAPPMGPLICYEIIFPGAVVAPGARPGWFLNVTNDAWFGDTPGPRQHFLQARLRAVEEGLPLVRAANSGISAIVDPYGRIFARLGVGESAVIDGELPAALQPTPYARWGGWLTAVLILSSILAAALGRWSAATETRN